MARQRSAVVDYGMYLAVRLVVCVFQALSWSAALGLARLLAMLAYQVDRRHRGIARENLRFAFPDLDEAARRRLLYATYEHLFMLVIESARLPRVLHAHNVDDTIRCAFPADRPRAISWLKSGRPLLVLTGHFGNWEVLNYTLGALGFRAAVLARRVDNPFLDRFLRRFRRKTGQMLLDKNQDYARVLEVLARGGVLGMVGDQDAGSRGLFVSFLGRPASTFKSIALLSLEYSAPILVLGAARIGQPIKYHLYLEDVILPEQHAGEPDPVRAITQRYTEALERMVRRHPEQYFWLHRRWKHQPQPKKSKKAA
jgi:KDO2-lipid IV(A) lauroyltransferase